MCFVIVSFKEFLPLLFLHLRKYFCFLSLKQVLTNPLVKEESPHLLYFSLITFSQETYPMWMNGDVSIILSLLQKRSFNLLLKTTASSNQNSLFTLDPKATYKPLVHIIDPFTNVIDP